jgi:hypothetical protein
MRNGGAVDEIRLDSIEKALNLVGDYPGDKVIDRP